MSNQIGQLGVLANLLYDFMPASIITPYIGAGAGVVEGETRLVVVGHHFVELGTADGKASGGTGGQRHYHALGFSGLRRTNVATRAQRW